LIAIYGFFIVYSTVVPFRFARDVDYIIKHLKSFQLTPFFDEGRFTSRADILVNIVFFIPLGIFLGLHKIIRYFRRFSLRDWVGITVSGAALSTFVEFLQIFTYDRSPSITDIINNTLGTFIGALFIYLIYVRFHRQIKEGIRLILADKPDMIIAASLLGLIFVSALAPFTFRVEIAIFLRQIREFLSNPFTMSGLFGEFFINFFLYGLLTYYLFRGIKIHFPDLQKNIKILILGSLVILPFASEILQLTVPDRRHSYLDPLSGWIGMVGGLVILYYQWSRFLQMSKNGLKKGSDFRQFADQHLFKLLTAIYFLFLGYYLVRPLLFFRDMAMFDENWKYFWDPFYWIMENNRLIILVDLIKYAFLFLPMGFLLAFHMPTRRWRILILAIPLIILWLGIKLVSSNPDVYWSSFLAAQFGVAVGIFAYEVYYYLQYEYFESHKI